MTATSFFDTNVFLYVVSAAPEDQPKRLQAEHLIRSQPFAISVQVLEEFADAALRRQRLGVTPDEVGAMLHQLASNFPVLPANPRLVLHALELSTRFQIRFNDASILAAAYELGCTTLFTEDFSHGDSYGTVTVINPFR